MNCLEFRRRLGSDPNNHDADFLAHREGCAGCAAAQARALAFEAELERALAIPVPEGLADRILLAQTTGERVAAITRSSRRRSRVAAALAVAASLVIVVVGVYRGTWPGTPLDRLVVDHVLHHEPHAIEARALVADADVRAAFASRGIDLPSVPAGISYVSECPVGPYRTVHMVMPEQDAAVSVVYVVDAAPAKPRVREEAGMRVREVPIGTGALVMVAADESAFPRIEQAWQEALAATPAARPLAAASWLPRASRARAGFLAAP